MMRLRSRFVVLAAVTVAAVLGLHAAVTGQEPAPERVVKMEKAPIVSSVDGKDLFVAYCAVCHGFNATGKGPAAPAMKEHVSDLTQLAKRNHGQFSYNDVETAITGKARLSPSHGSEDMPVWGQVFRVNYPEDASMIRVRNLVTYIRSIQK